MNFSIEQIDYIRTCKAEDWSDLIVTAIREWLENDYVAVGFGPLSSVVLVEQDSGIAIGLAEFYQSIAKVDRSAQTAFRDGLRHAVRKSTEVWPGYKELEALLGVVHAIKTSECNQVLLQAAQCDGFRGLRELQQSNLFGLMLSILRQQPPTSSSSPLSDQAVSVAATLTALCRISTFPQKLVYRAFEVLTSSDPARVIEHLELLEDRLQRLRRDGREFPVAWLENLRRFSAQFPSRQQIEESHFGWANDWLLGDTITLAMADVAPYPTLLERGRGLISRTLAPVNRAPSTKFVNLKRDPPKNWTSRPKSASIKETDDEPVAA